MKTAKGKTSKVNWIQKTCPQPADPQHTKQKTKIMQDIMKPETVKEILESLKTITTAINQIMTVTTKI